MAAKEVWKGPPALVLFYSGGYTREEGLKTQEPLRAALKKRGITDQLTLDHSNEYGFTGEGYEAWPRYVDKLVELIDRDFAGRQLVIFGHSKGTGPAMSVASRLGQRVLKCYVASCGSWLPGRPTPWEKLSRTFKLGNDQGLLAWFASLNPGNRLLETVAYAPEDQFDEVISGSSFLKSKLELMRLQYKDAMYPDMANKAIDVFPAELCAVSPLFDPGSQPLDMIGFRKFSKSFELWEFLAGHADVLTNEEFHRRLGDDILEFFTDDPKPRPPKKFEVQDRWLTPVRETPMARHGLPTVSLKSAPRLTPAELKEINALLKASSQETPLELEGLTDSLDEVEEGVTGRTRSVKIDIGDARPLQKPGLPKGKEKVAAEAAKDEHTVTVDLDRGPLVRQPDGSSKVLFEVPSFAKAASRIPAYTAAKPKWRNMPSTDQKVLLVIAARMNKAMDERVESAKKAGRTIDSGLPDFLRSYAPRGKDDHERFWDHFEVKEVEGWA